MMLRADDAPQVHMADLSAGECCAQAQMASYARLEAARHAREQRAGGRFGFLCRLLLRRWRSGRH